MGEDKHKISFPYEYLRMNDYILFAGQKLLIKDDGSKLQIQFQGQVVAEATTKEELLIEFEDFKKTLARANSDQYLNPHNTNEGEKEKVIKSWFPDDMKLDELDH